MKKILEKRKYRILLAFISFIFLIDLMQDTYAKYITSADANSNLTIASWSFLVNTQDVIDDSDFSTTIIPTFDQNSNIASNVIAPTSTGHFEVEIDSTNVGVNFNETIVVTKNASNTIDDLVFTGYKVNNGSVVSLQNLDTVTLNNVHTTSDLTKVNTYTFYFEWNDDAQTETMDNEDDTAATIDGVASIDVNLSFVQSTSANNQNNNNNNNNNTPPEP